MSLYDYWVKIISLIIGETAPQFLFTFSFIFFIILFFGCFFKLIKSLWN